MVRVSVIIPCYNGAQYLPDALDSALAQTFGDFELLIVDDGSTDDTAEVAGRYIARDRERVHYLHQPNCGLAVARNTAISHARGDLLALLDCDDIWTPERLAEGIALMDARPEVGLTHANIVYVDGEKRPIREDLVRQEQYLSGRIFEHIYTRRAHLACPTVLFRRECVERVGGFDPELTRLGCEDRDLWLRIARKYDVAYLPKALAYYRVTAGSMSRNREKMLKARLYVLDKYGEPTMHSRYLRRQALAGIYQEMALLARGAGVPGEARGWWMKSLAACPWQRRFAAPALRGLLAAR